MIQQPTWPEVAKWEAVRTHIAHELTSGNLNPDSPRHDATAEALWREMLGIWTPSLAMAVYYMPEIYSAWPAYWHDYVLRQYATGLNCAIAGPRRRGKSAIFRAHQMYQMLTLRWTFSTHICLSPELVLEHSEAVIHQLETNRRLQAAFNIHPGTIQRQEHFQIQVGKSHRTTLKFEWMTRDGKSRGTGRHGIGVDDIDDSEDSPYIMQKYNDKMHGSVLGSLEDFSGTPSQVIVSGNYTGQHCNMILFQNNDAVKNADRWVVMVIPAIEEGKTQHITKTAIGESTWARFTTKETRQKIADMNVSKLRSGDMEMQNKIADAGKLLWHEGMFTLRFKKHEVEPQHRLSRIYVDSAQKTDEAGDDWAIGRLTKVFDGPHAGEIWIERVHLDPLDPDTAIDIALDMFVGDGTNEMPQCEMVAKEGLTTQGIDPWLNDLVKTARRERGMYVSTKVIVASKDKRTRSIDALPVGSSRSLRTPDVWDEHMTRCIDQMCTFTGDEGHHLTAIDDGHDMVVHGINDLKNRVGRHKREARRSEPVKMRNRLRAVG